MSDLPPTLVAVSVMAVVVGFFYRHFRRHAPDVPPSCLVAAAIALTLGTVTAMAGLAHSIGVASLALREPDYGPLQVLRFTTGAMLVYTGAMHAALHRMIGAGRRWAMSVSAASSALFLLYLTFLQPLPGGGGTVPPMLALWVAYLISLGVAAITLYGRRRSEPRTKE